jgi:uncharacterized membrane protein
MSVDNDAGPEPEIFSAVLRPHRSLSQTGFLLVMLLVGGTSFIGGLFFFIAGAWPVVGFFGLDVLLVYWAFRASYRSAAGYEFVRVTPSELKVLRMTHRGHRSEWSLNPLWTQLDKQIHREYGIERLFLVSRGRRFPIANFLGPAEKETFAIALNAALGEAKRGLTRTVFP